MLGEAVLDGVAAESGALAGGEQWVGWLAGVLVKPGAHDGDGGVGERSDALLASLPQAADVRAVCEVDVAAAQAGEL
jgi:hypothetical protein